ncbi:PIN domain-containing protein [bacterium]|nr:MAG: PIN domain-containing protein [bacterium]
MRFLLDSAVLIARCSVGHEHHARAKAWMDVHPEFAVCPITEGALVRFVSRISQNPNSEPAQVLAMLAKIKGYEFWPDDLSYASIRLDLIFGHKQATDTYLVALAEHRGSRLATFDLALARVHAEALLIPG